MDRQARTDRQVHSPQPRAGRRRAIGLRAHPSEVEFQTPSVGRVAVAALALAAIIGYSTGCSGRSRRFGTQKEGGGLLATKLTGGPVVPGRNHSRPLLA